MPSSSGNGLRDELAFLLAEIGALASRLRVSNRSVHATDGLPDGGKFILQSLAQAGPQTVPQIARARSSSRQNVQVLMNRLEADGWVEFVDNPAHKRSDLVRLTKQGEDLLLAANEREAIFLAGLLKHTTEAEVLSAGQLISRLRALLEKRPPAEFKATLRGRFRNQSAAHSTKIVKTKIEPVSEASESLGDELPVNLL